jgi:C-terminal processing protease CtpA/Prc
MNQNIPPMKSFLNVFLSTVFFASVLFPSSSTLSAQTLDSFDRTRVKDILNAVKGEIKDNYYDKNLHGINLDERFKLASEKLEKAASMGQAFSIIAQAVLELNDSHTTFYPPSRASKVEYGWRMLMVADKCFVVAVKPKSEAENLGLKIGDEILKIEGNTPTRKDFWKIRYYFNSLSPRESLRLSIKSPGEKNTRELNIPAKVTQLKSFLSVPDLIRQSELNDIPQVENLFAKVGKTAVWKMPTFSIDPESIGGLISNVMDSSNLVLDLRSNGGGYVVTLERLVGYFIDQDIKIADLKGRKEMKPQMAKTKGKEGYKGNLIVLIDSQSASASEIFARFMQLQQRGVVIGDQSAGAVMQSRGISMKIITGVQDEFIPYYLNMTNADVIMSDGMSLERVGVTPQLLMNPSAEDIALKRDKVLSTALKLLGEDVTPEQAGSYFKYNWREGYRF